MTARNRFLQIKETCIYSRELEKVKEFYSGVLGLEVISFVTGKHVFFRAGSSVLLCFDPDDSKMKQSPPSHYAAGKYHFAFEVSAADYEWQKAELIRQGVVVTDQVVWKTGQESFYFEDPAGNVLEVVPVGIW